MQLQKQIVDIGLRQDWIAQQLGISTAYLSMLLTGKRQSKQLTKRIKQILKQRAVNVTY